MKHLLFYSEKLIRQEFNNVSTLLINCTFKTAPNLRDEPYVQLFTAMGVLYGHVSWFFNTIIQIVLQICLSLSLNICTKNFHETVSIYLKQQVL